MLHRYTICALADTYISCVHLIYTNSKETLSVRGGERRLHGSYGGAVQELVAEGDECGGYDGMSARRMGKRSRRYNRPHIESTRA